jgi:hypothetical protein
MTVKEASLWLGDAADAKNMDLLVDHDGQYKGKLITSRVVHEIIKYKFAFVNFEIACNGTAKDAINLLC